MTTHPGRPDSTSDNSLPAVWTGVESSHLRIGRRTVDQLALTGHDGRTGDLERLASLGASAVRYPILWERIAPRGLAGADWTWADDRLRRLRKLGLEPVVGLLHHGQGPKGISLRHPGFVAEFASYAGAVARRYPWINRFLPINEPLTTARFGGLYGWWPPHARSERTFGRLLLTQVLAIRAAARQIREVNSEATIVVNEDVGRTFCTEPLVPDARYLNERRWLTWDLLCGRVTPGHAMYELLATTPRARRDLADLAANPEVPGLLGVDHYVTSDRYLDHRVGLYPAGLRDPLCPTFIDIEACRVRGVPARSIARAIGDTWRRYRLPIALTEISLAGQPDDQVCWWKEAWDAASRARASGIDVRAVTAWAAFGATDWHSLMRRAEGIYEPGVFDVSHVPPRRRPVAEAVLASATESRMAISPGSLEARRPMPKSGWWTRRDRFVVTSPA